jgi:hypothetical protein
MSSSTCEAEAQGLWMWGQSEAKLQDPVSKQTQKYTNGYI